MNRGPDRAMTCAVCGRGLQSGEAMLVYFDIRADAGRDAIVCRPRAGACFKAATDRERPGSFSWRAARP